MNEVYARAWKLVLKRLQEKTSWGRTELIEMMLQCFIEVGDPPSAREQYNG